jgi:hypothetical protein
VLISHFTNLGLTRMADACGIAYDVLAWTSEWYVREETLRAENLALIGDHREAATHPNNIPAFRGRCSGNRPGSNSPCLWEKGLIWSKQISTR